MVIMRDDMEKNDPLFPTSTNIMSQMRQMGKRCEPGDFFVFFYAGHGENVPDRPPLDEDDGQDEAFVTPGPQCEIDAKFFFVDDDFAKSLETFFDPDVRILCVLDCCHSATMADINSYDYKDHKILSMAACKDSEESADTGKGGILTIAIEKAMRQLSLKRGSDEYSI